jgi:hypothetical protein
MDDSFGAEQDDRVKAIFLRIAVNQLRQFSGEPEKFIALSPRE